jgi:predicted nucleotidyltransferase
MSTKTKVKSLTLTPLILEYLAEKKIDFEQEGLTLLGLFGSYARGEEDSFSDIDIAYKIDHNKFFKDDAFKKLLRIEEIKKELELNFHKKVDIISLNSDNHRLNESIKKEMILI